VYFVAEDDEGTPNLQSSVTKVDATTSAAPDTTANAPTALSATAGNGQVTVTFTAPTNTGGAAITNYEYSTDGGTTWTAFSPAATTSPVTIGGLTNGTSYDIALRALNSAGAGTASAVVSVTTLSPRSAFEAVKDTVREIIANDAARSLQSTITANQRMVRDARERFISEDLRSRCTEWAEADCTTETINSGTVPLAVDGSFELNGTTLSTSGTFFGQAGGYEGTSRRLTFGDFDIQHDSATGSSTATLTGRVAWENMVSSQTLLGYFTGGELAYSNLEGTLSGSQNRVGITVGAYAVQKLGNDFYLDGFVSLGAGLNNLELTDYTLALESDYTTRTAMIGAALSGVFDYGLYQLRPELYLSYGRTWIGSVDFVGSAYGLADDQLSLDAGSVTLANVMFRPEFLVPLDGLRPSDSRSTVTIAPRLICEHLNATTDRSACGGGFELGLKVLSKDDLGLFNAKIQADRLGDMNRTGLQLNFERQF
jgi:hypothetical protein